MPHFADDKTILQIPHGLLVKANEHPNCRKRKAKIKKDAATQRSSKSMTGFHL